MQYMQKQIYLSTEERDVSGGAVCVNYSSPNLIYGLGTCKQEYRVVLLSALKLHLFLPELQTPGLKGLSHEIFMVIFQLEQIYLGLNENRYWFLNFKEGYSILDSYFKY